LFELLATDPNLAGLTIPPEHLADVIARLGDVDRERFLHLRNGMARSLRIPDPLPPGEASAILATARNAGTINDRATYDRASHMLETEPREFWNLIARFHLPAILSVRNATPQALAALLPAWSEHWPTLPTTLALPLVPAAGHWLVQTLVNGEGDLEPLQRRAGAKDLIPASLRAAIETLSAIAQWTVPADDAEWTSLTLALLRRGIEDPESTIGHALNRPMEPERHLRIAARLQQGANPWLAMRSVREGLLLHPEHERLEKAHRFLEENLTNTTEILVAHPEGCITRLAGEDPAWSVLPPEAPPSTPLDELGLPPAIVRILAGAGLHSSADLQESTDEDLLALSGIGPRRLEQVRTALDSI